MTESLIQSIHAALADGASDEARATGVAACRTILGVLEATHGTPIVATPPTSPIASIVHALRGMPADQLLDLAIAKLRGLVPDAATPPTLRLAIPTVRR
jgi:hypothetical protein